MSVPVKVCGITRLEDARAAEAAGARAVGFIFHPPSPRYIAPQQARRIAAALHPWTLRVGVFVGLPAPQVNAIAATVRLDRIQLHGGEPHAMLTALAVPGYRVFRPRSPADLAELRREPDRVIMLDTYDESVHGGTGRAVHWDWAAALAAERTVILSGGLTPENAAAAIGRVRPAALDVSSGVERAPGEKDAARIAAFLRAVARASCPADRAV